MDRPFKATVDGIDYDFVIPNHDHCLDCPQLKKTRRVRRDGAYRWYCKVFDVEIPPGYLNGPAHARLKRCYDLAPSTMTTGRRRCD